jgi:mono/diheme cytochrome c family protein
MKNKYLLLISSLGVLALLMAAAWQESFRREWRQVQAAGRTDEGAIPVQLRQIVNPALQSNDRCVSCHVAMGPGEQSVGGSKLLAPHKPVVHDPADYGCTVCHGGQGAATDKADAHGEVEFWPQPMLPARYSYAGCGACHSALGVPEKEQMLQAGLAFERLDCLTCHRVEGRGGTIRPGGAGMEGPDLSRSGLVGYDREWYPKHLDKAAKAAEGPWKTFASITENDRSLLALYLATRSGASRLVEAKSVFHSAGCLGCHKVSGVGGEEGLDLSRAGEKDPGQIDFTWVPGAAVERGRQPALANWLGEHFRSPGALVAGSQMPILGLSESDIDLLTMYVLSLRRRDMPATYTPKDRVRAVRFGEREFAADGATIFGAFCAGCHGPDGMGRRSPGMARFPAIANPDFQSRVSDDFLTQTITHGRPGRRMPAWGELTGGLRPEEIAKVVQHLRSLSGVSPKADPLPPRWLQSGAAPGRGLQAGAAPPRGVQAGAALGRVVQADSAPPRGGQADAAPGRGVQADSAPPQGVQADAGLGRGVQTGAALGRQLFAASCSGCHGQKGEGGEGPALNNPVLLANATDTYLVETIANGRRGTAMPAFGTPSAAHPTYSRGEIEAIAAYVRAWAGSKR